jgi:hypothetical protein
MRKGGTMREFWERAPKDRRFRVSAANLVKTTIRHQPLDEVQERHLFARMSSSSNSPLRSYGKAMKFVGMGRE